MEHDSAGRHRFLGFVVATPDFRVYHSGDCVPFESLVEETAAARRDLALLPANGRSAALRADGSALSL